MRLYKDTHSNTQFLTLFFYIMSKSVLISLLAQGNTGNEILQILDTLAEDNQQSISYNEPTANPIEF
jgi:hypothetical protein